MSAPIFDVLLKHCHSSEDGRKHRFYTMNVRDWCNIIPGAAAG